MNWDRVERLIGADNLRLLSQKCVGIVGLGSGGSFVAQGLAMSGVGKFVLVDADTLEETNVVRHAADRRDVGRAKAEATADLIRQRNPDAQIDVRVGRIEDNLDILDHLDILVVAVDNEGAKYFVNQQCLDRGLTAVYAGVYERGEGGDVVIIRPYDGPCYACWAAELRENLPGEEASQELDYGMIGPQGTLEAEPGLWLHVVRVAAVQADLVLNELLRGTSASEEMPANTIIMANNSLEIIAGQMNEPHTAVWVDVARDPDCLVCGPGARLRAGLTGETGEEALSLSDLAEQAGITLEEEDPNQ